VSGDGAAAPAGGATIGTVGRRRHSATHPGAYKQT
jgi:hypothetical protein